MINRYSNGIADDFNFDTVTAEITKQAETVKTELPKGASEIQKKSAEIIQAVAPQPPAPASNGIIQQIGKIHPAILGGALGVAAWYFSKSWLGAAVAGAATYYITDKLQKS